MGRQGQAPRPFSRIHRQYGTPFWSVASATGVIVALIVVFIGLFPAEGGVIRSISRWRCRRSGRSPSRIWG